MDGDWREDLERWLEPFLNGLGHKTRRRMCPAYIAGLIGPGDRKSVQPMAARGGEARSGERSRVRPMGKPRGRRRRDRS